MREADSLRFRSFPRLRSVHFSATLLTLVIAVQSAPFTLTAERTRYLLGEPVYLRIGSREVRPPSLEEGSLVLLLRGPDGKEREYHPPLRLRTRPVLPPAGTSVADQPANANPPQERIRYARLIVADDSLVFRKPGRYRLRLVSPISEVPDSGRTVLSDSARRVISDSLIIAFSLPVRKADKRAYSILSRNPGEYGLAVYLEGGQQFKSGMAILGELADFPNAYRREAAFVLTSDWAQDFTDYHGGSSRRLDLAKAMAMAQWDLQPGAYIPLRTAFLLRNAVNIVAVRNPADSSLAAIRLRLNGFRASLPPREAAWLNSF